MRKYYYCERGYREQQQLQGAQWVSVEEPDNEDLRYMINQLHVPSMFLEYLEDMDERPRIEREGEWMMTIVRIPVASDDDSMPFRTIPLGIISKPEGVILTVCYHSNELVSDFVNHSCRKSICVRTVADFTLRIIFATAYWYLHYLKTITDDVVGAEKDLQQSVRNDDLLWMMRLQKSLVFFNTSIKGDVMLLERVRKMYSGNLDMELLDDVDIELRQADSTVGIYSDILEGTMDSYASIISNNVNGVMKRMSGLSIILMVPTFVASLYGMNVNILLHGDYAFWIIIAIAVALTVVVYLWLRRLKWV